MIGAEFNGYFGKGNKAQEEVVRRRKDRCGGFCKKDGTTYFKMRDEHRVTA